MGDYKLDLWVQEMESLKATEMAWYDSTLNSDSEKQELI